MVTGDLLSRARAGDGEAFRELAESHRRELQVHCYRMLGSFPRSERLMTSKGREPADHGNRWRNPVAVGAFRA